METIILYTIHCPKCNVLEKKLQGKNIKFEVIDDERTLIEQGFASKNFPLLLVDDKLMEYSEAVAWVNKKEN